jgi:hypothetical protein
MPKDSLVISFVLAREIKIEYLTPQKHHDPMSDDMTCNGSDHGYGGVSSDLVLVRHTVRNAQPYDNKPNEPSYRPRCSLQ